MSSMSSFCDSSSQSGLFPWLDDIVDHDYTTDAPISGRWTREEHSRFLEAYSLYGKDWKSVAEYVKSRTMIQVNELSCFEDQGPKSRSKVFCKA